MLSESDRAIMEFHLFWGAQRTKTPEAVNLCCLSCGGDHDPQQCPEIKASLIVGTKDFYRTFDRWCPECLGYSNGRAVCPECGWSFADNGSMSYEEWKKEFSESYIDVQYASLLHRARELDAVGS